MTSRSSPSKRGSRVAPMTGSRPYRMRPEYSGSARTGPAWPRTRRSRMMIDQGRAFSGDRKTPRQGPRPDEDPDPVSGWWSNNRRHVVNPRHSLSIRYTRCETGVALNPEGTERRLRPFQWATCPHDRTARTVAFGSRRGRPILSFSYSQGLSSWSRGSQLIVISAEPTV